LTGVETQAAKYSEGLPNALPVHQRPLPFLYQSTGVETRFSNWLDLEPRSRCVFHFHRPESQVAWPRRAPSAGQDTGNHSGLILPISRHIRKIGKKRRIV